MLKLIKCDDNDININSYVIVCDECCMVIDPNNYDDIVKNISDKKLDYILLTHEHFDHILAVDRLRDKFQAKVVAQALTSKNIQSPVKNLSKFSQIIYEHMEKTSASNIEPFAVKQADITYDDELILEWCGYKIFFKHTPGHSEGSSCIFINQWMFSGDSLFDLVSTSFMDGKKAKKIYNDITIPFFNSLDKNFKVFAGHYKEFMLKDRLNSKELL